MHIKFKISLGRPILASVLIALTIAVAAYIAWEPSAAQSWNPSVWLARSVVFLMQSLHPELLRGLAVLYVLSGIDSTIGLIRSGGDDQIVIELLENDCVLQLATGKMTIRREELEDISSNRWGHIVFKTYDSSFKRRWPGGLRRKYPLLAGTSIVGLSPHEVRDVVDLWRAGGLAAAVGLFARLEESSSASA